MDIKRVEELRGRLLGEVETLLREITYLNSKCPTPVLVQAATVRGTLAQYRRARDNAIDVSHVTRPMFGDKEG